MFKLYDPSHLRCAKCTHSARDHTVKACTICNNCDFFLEESDNKLFVGHKGNVIEIKHPLNNVYCICGGELIFLYKAPLKTTVHSDFWESGYFSPRNYCLYRCKVCQRLAEFDIDDDYKNYLIFINSEN